MYSELNEPVPSKRTSPDEVISLNTALLPEVTTFSNLIILILLAGKH